MTETIDRSQNIVLCNDCIYKALIDSAYFGVIAVDNQGYLLYLNDKAREMIRFTGEINYPSVHYSQINYKTWLEYKKVIQTGKFQIAVPVRNELRSFPYVANRTPLVRNGKIIGAVSVFQNMEEYEKISKHLREYQKLTKEVEAIIENSYDGIYVTDGEANTIRVNSAYEKITGIKASEVIGQNMRDLVRGGYFSESATLKVLEKRERVTLNQSLITGKEILVTGNPIYNEKNEIIMVVTNVRDMTDLVDLNRKLNQALDISSVYKERLQELQRSAVQRKNLIAASKEMQAVCELIDRVAETDATVLIDGETGVGKDRVAEEIHDKSSRSKKGIFVKINCGAIPENLLESELFGYEGGAFTGAKREGKAGLFEVADGGTLFLDEIESMPKILQPKLLRILQNFEITRVGGTKTKKVDVRLICASNENLKDLVDQKAFRADLYYRLNVVPVHIPSLRDRPDDIPYLITFFVERYNKKHSANKTFDKKVYDALLHYKWPGNVRELANLIERLVVIVTKQSITVRDLPAEIFQSLPLNEMNFDDGLTLKKRLERYEVSIIREAVRKYGSARKAAPFLGVDSSTLTRKLQKNKTG